LTSHSTASIDLSALRHNLNVVRRLVGDRRKITAMIKADAYGHGLLPVAKALTDADMLGVVTVAEALALRKANVNKPIIVMMGFTTSEELELFFQYQLSPVIHHPLQLELLERFNASQPIPVWLKVDTGMNRLGFPVDAFQNAFERLSKIKVVQQPIHLMTHLADSDRTDSDFTQRQLQLFAQLTKTLPGLKSVSNSAGILAYPNSLVDVVRPGIMLYGASPFVDRVAADFYLKPVMHLTSKIIAIKPLQQGDHVGYGCTWKCPENMNVAVVAIGYGDGYPRHIQENTPVLINRVLCPIVGRVSMDMITVDLRQQPNAQIGDEVVLWGRGLSIEKIALSAGTIPYELLCQLTQRVVRK